MKRSIFLKNIIIQRIFAKTKISLALAVTFANYKLEAVHYFLHVVPRAKRASFFAARRSPFVGIKRSFTITTFKNVRDYLESNDKSEFNLHT